MGNISIKNWLENNKSEMCYTYLVNTDWHRLISLTSSSPQAQIY